MRVLRFCLFSFILSVFIHISAGARIHNAAIDLLVKCPDTRMELDVSQLNVHFYDFQKNMDLSFPIDEAAKGIIKKLDKNKQFYMFVGGYTTHIDHPTTNLVKETFKNVTNSSLIIVDHSPYTNDFDGLQKTYKRSVKYVYSIGVQLAKMLAELNKGGISAKHIHAIGHSLGSQILGHVGQNFIKITNKKIARITALDPAGPCFSNRPNDEQVRAGVAEYVEVFHCDAGSLGTTSVLGDIDFFVNEGKSEQPQCKLPFYKVFKKLKPDLCSHTICVSMWMSTVTNGGFQAVQCDSYKLFKAGKCSNNKNTTAGFWNSDRISNGSYYFSTEAYTTF